MLKIERLILIVLDSAGIGALPDAGDYGDCGTNTLGHIREKTPGFSLPNLYRFGLDILLGDPVHPTLGGYGRMAEKSCGKDTTVGHWEMMGCMLEKPFPVYPDGFPPELIAEFERKIGRKTIGNVKASGTEIIMKLGGEHLSTGFPIVYTSADSIFQIAAHEEVIPVEQLYEFCRIAREMLSGEHGVARVVARPFSGRQGSFQRTERRHDFSLEPFRKTALDHLLERGSTVHALGKINDIYAGKGISAHQHTSSNQDGMEKLLKCMNRVKKGLIFLNLVDFDMKYGHRRDVAGYYRALAEFDDFLPKLQAKLATTDCLILTADHGCDPTHTGTDHTREYVPIMSTGNHLRKNLDLGTRTSFADLGATTLQLFNVNPPDFPGHGFAGELIF
ncbi:MAG: phosphopentomutase [Candidatus Wallbacteria bacterium]|nr:phosphopentomutase [Candidatus Wallbacteria bacterium]